MLLCRATFGRFMPIRGPPDVDEIRTAIRVGEADSVLGYRDCVVPGENLRTMGGSFRECILPGDGLIYPEYLITYVPPHE